MKTAKIALFKNRKILYQNDLPMWWCVINDVIEALTDSTETWLNTLSK
jgi:hypothetical protein